jgi:FkbM family methyltransferase
MGVVYGGEAVTFEPGLICERWKLMLPDFRVDFHAARPKWEIGRLEYMAERVQPGMAVWDIGAECGDFTALYRSWGAEVVPIEPMPAMWPSIRQSFEANGFEPPPAWFAGFAADRTWRQLDGFGRDGWPSQTIGPVVADPGFLHLAHHARTVPCTTIDDLARLVGPPDIISMDIEGAEWHALSGARQTLRERDVLVYVSVHEPTMRNWYDRGLDDLHILMREVGYEGEQLPHHGEGETFWLYEGRP